MSSNPFKNNQINIIQDIDTLKALELEIIQLARRRFNNDSEDPLILVVKILTDEIHRLGSTSQPDRKLLLIKLSELGEQLYDEMAGNRLFKIMAALTDDPEAFQKLWDSVFDITDFPHNADLFRAVTTNLQTLRV